jgi:hypothetical protein
MSVRIVLCSSPVQLTAGLARNDQNQLLLDAEGKPQLVLKHRGESLADHGDTVEIFLESEQPVTVVIGDFDGWTVTATPKGNAADPGGLGDDWERQGTLCCTKWSETDRPMPVTVTATNGPVAAHKPIFIKVLPVGVKPWP